MKRKFPALLLSALILALAGCRGASPDKDFETFEPDAFPTPTKITNTWLPLQPGTQYVYEGFTNDDAGNRISRRLVITVTDLTKVIDGIHTLITWDRDYNGEDLVEAELAFYAQDDEGTVWRMGEHPEEYKQGEFIDSPTWLSGIDDAVAGIEMPGDPQAGQPSYSEGWAPDVDFTDRGQVTQTGQKVCVKAGCYENVIVITETSKAEPDASQLKYFAPDVGNIMTNWNGSDQTQETLELTEIVHLDAQALSEVRASALDLEKSAYDKSKDVFAKTGPAEPLNSQ